MTNVRNGLIAGFAGTAAMSMVMVMKGLMGVMPELNAIEMMATMAADMTGMPTGTAFGWVMHFGIGTVMWGGLYGLIAPRAPVHPVVASVGLAVGAWLMMMVAVMPMAGAGLFGLSFGVMAPMATLMMHLVYGVVLGGVYGQLPEGRAEPRLSHA